MKKIIIAATAALLSACATSKGPQVDIAPAPPPNVKNWPDHPPVVVPAPVQLVTLPPLPDVLSKSPPKLPPLVDGTPKGIQRDGAKTDSMYNTLAARYRALVKTYNCAREAANTGDASKIC